MVGDGGLLVEEEVCRSHHEYLCRGLEHVDGEREWSLGTTKESGLRDLLVVVCPVLQVLSSGDSGEWRG